MENRKPADGNLDFRRRKSGLPLRLGLLGDNKRDLVHIGLALSPSFNLDQGRILKLFDEPVDTCNAHTQIVCKALLTREAKIVVPGVAQELRIDDDRTHRQSTVLEEEVGHLGEAVLGNDIGAYELDVSSARLDVQTDVVHGSSIREALLLTGGYPLRDQRM